jgi:two-component system chemotaxis response regulator CheB
MTVHHGVVQLRRTPKQHFTRPAADPLFRSAAHTYGRRVVGVVLSGSGSDGAAGCIAIKEAGGLSLVQSEDEASHTGMPRSSILQDGVDAVLPVHALAGLLVALAAGDARPAPSGAEWLAHERAAGSALWKQD